ncbi:hypothetical protein [Roseibium alexandrii]
MPINGHDATKAEMRALKVACAAIIRHYKAKKDNRFNWMTLLNKHIGLEVSEGYEANLQKGIAGQDTVLKIYNWIIAHELSIACEAAPSLFSPSLVTSWQNLLKARGTYGALHTKPYSTGQLHEISALHPISDVRIKLGQEFVFELESAIDGAVIAFDCYKTQSYPVPLNSNGGIDPVRIDAGVAGFPVNDTGGIVPMRQRAHPGEHAHCFVVGPEQLLRYYTAQFENGKAIPSTTLDDMARRFEALDKEKLGIYLENVIFE